MGLLHVSCLEHWLNTQNVDHCEVCKHRFPTMAQATSIHQFFYWALHAGSLWIVLGDLLCFTVMTPLTALSCFYCAHMASKQALERRIMKIGTFLLLIPAGHEEAGKPTTAWTANPGRDKARHVHHAPVGMDGRPFKLDPLGSATYCADAIFSAPSGATTVREALDFLKEALRRVVINGLKINLRKCQLIQDNVSFLGYVIFAEGRTLDESRVAAVEKFEPHRNAKKLYSFLQFANHFRKFIQEFAKVTHKLRHLLAKNVPFVWNDAHEATVNAIKHALKNPTILASFRPDCPTNVHVDASQTELGVVLSQT
ncbi:hypothetical protein MRX96_017306 [Rhipicephalus microplus]